MTLELMIAEVRSILAGNADRLQPPIPFRNFVAEVRLGVDHAKQEAFFRAMLGDIDEPTAPLGLVDVLGDGSAIAEARFRLNSDLAERLHRSVRRHGVTAASLFHLAWALVLARLSGRDDVVFGTVLLGRFLGGVGADRAFGLFINTLPLRVNIKSASVTRALRETQDDLAQLLRYDQNSPGASAGVQRAACGRPTFHSAAKLPPRAGRARSRSSAGRSVAARGRAHELPLGPLGGRNPNRVRSDGSDQSSNRADPHLRFYASSSQIHRERT